MCSVELIHDPLKSRPEIRYEDALNNLHLHGILHDTQRAAYQGQRVISRQARAEEASKRSNGFPSPGTLAAEIY